MELYNYYEIEEEGVMKHSIPSSQVLSVLKNEGSKVVCNCEKKYLLPEGHLCYKIEQCPACNVNVHTWYVTEASFYDSEMKERYTIKGNSVFFMLSNGAIVCINSRGAKLITQVDKLSEEESERRRINYFKRHKPKK